MRSRSAADRIRAMSFCTVMALSLLLLVLVNLVAQRCDFLFPFPGARQRLSERTREALASLTGRIECVAVIPQSDRLFHELRGLLLDMKDAATNAEVTLTFLDPHTDLGHSADAIRRYGAGGWAVVFDDGSRTATVPYSELIESPRTSQDTSHMASPLPTRFVGEAACMAALTRLIHPEEPVIYSVSGHGERDFASYDRVSGYSDFAREMSREGYLLRRLPPGTVEIPADCSVLVVAGPRTAPSDFESIAILEYLGRGGALMFLVDRPDRMPSGWEGVLARVGVEVSGFSAIGGGTLGDYRLLTDNISEHAVVEGLSGDAVCFVNPPVLDILPDTPVSATSIVMAPAGSWGESTPDSLPRHYDPGVDRQGDLTLAAAIQGPHGDDLGIRALHAFVVSGSDFASNALLDGGSTANRDLLMNALNWLAARRLAAAPSSGGGSGVLRLAIPRKRQIRFWLHSVAAWPALVAVIGLVMAWIRRHTA